MRRNLNKLGGFIPVAFGLLFVAGCASAPPDLVFHVDDHAKPSMSVDEALKQLKSNLESQSHKIQDLKLTREGFSFKLVENQNVCSMKFDEIHDVPLWVSGLGGDKLELSSSCHLIWSILRSADKGSNNFIDAVASIKYYNNQADVIMKRKMVSAEFQEKAKVWRALPQKPKIPEKIRRFRILAEDATESKDFEKAVDYYEQGLAIEPMWPVGQFNAAIIYGELKDYDRAIIHMKRYLELEPDVKDNRACQDKIYLWEGKIGEGSANNQ